MSKYQWKYHLNLEIMGKKQRKHAHLRCSVWILILYLWCCILLDDQSIYMTNGIYIQKRKEKRTKTKPKHVNTEKLKPVISNPGVQL